MAAWLPIRKTAEALRPETIYNLSNRGVGSRSRRSGMMRRRYGLAQERAAALQGRDQERGGARCSCPRQQEEGL